MEVHLDCGGGITGFNYCAESGTGENCDVNYSCEAADFLTNIIGDDYMVLLIDNPGTASISYSENGSTDFNYIDTQFGVNYISNLEPCTNYNVKTSITCSNDKIRESEILNFTTDDCTDLNKEGQTEVLAGINLFPNPVSDFLTVNYDGAKVKQITIYDTVGKTIETFNTNASGSSSLNVQRYVPGVYILVSSSNGASFSQKFIVE